MVDRIKLTQDVYMPIEGQWALLGAGSVIDVPNKSAFSASNTTVLSPGEPAGTLKNAAHSVPVRGVWIK